MKAAFYTKQGPAAEVLEIGEQSTPVPSHGEVRVRIHASGVNPSDVKNRSGLFGPKPFPLIIPHSDGAGIIDQVGEGVAKGLVGERVWIWNGQWHRPFGTAAEYICVPRAQAVYLPDHVEYAAGACLGIPALTAWQAVDIVDAKPGRTVLVSGGAGAVGHYAVQIAKSRGARVITTVSSDAKMKHAKRAGADEAINYRNENVGYRVKELTEGLGVDAVIELDFTANASLIPQVLRPRGRVAVYGFSGALAELAARFFLMNSISLHFFLVYDLTAAERAIALAGLEMLLKENRLMHEVGKTLPLPSIATAHELVEAGSVLGNVVVTVD